MTKLCLCLTGKTLAQDLELLQKYRKYVDIAELRVDHLNLDEQLLIRSFPSQAGIPIILTIRRKADGGNFIDGEGRRIALLSKGLAFAEVDRRKNFAYVDLEEDLSVPSLEEAARTFGTRIIRSYHDTQGAEGNLAEKLKSLLRVGDEIPKVAVNATTFSDVTKLFTAAEALPGVDKIILGMGHLALCTRILAAKLGSLICYASATDDPDLPVAAPGQISPRELVELYNIKSINAQTALFGVVGYPLSATSSPAFFNQVFKEEQYNAAYLPFPTDSLEDFLSFAEMMHISGLSITIPYKEAILPRLASSSEMVKAIGACNTIVHSDEGWIGNNTDYTGFADSLTAFVGKKDLKGSRITIIGAGGAARAVAAAIHQLKGKALILNRTALRAKQIAGAYKFDWAELNAKGIEKMHRYNQIIIQTTSVGMEPDIAQNPLPEYQFTGKELVMDIIYKPEKTLFLQQAEAAGCAIANGYDMLLRQARYQYRYFMGREFPPQLMSRIRM